MPSRTLPWRRRVVRALRHPRTAIALKAAVAAATAWAVALTLPEPFGSYPYYAPLGAVVATYPTVASSVRESLQSAASIVLGAALAVVADAVLGSGVLVVAVVVLLGVLLGGIRALGAQRSWVPTAALFVLVVGGHDDVGYAASYAGLFVLGAVIAIAVNAAFPSLGLTRVDDSLDALRDALAERLRYVAARFADPADPADPAGRGDSDADDAGTDPPGAPDRAGLTEQAAATRDVVRGVLEARRANLRARRRPDAIRSRYDAFRALDRVVPLVDDLYDLVEDAPWGRDPRTSAAALREPAGRALTELARAVEAVGVEAPDPARRAAVDGAIADLTRAVRAREATGADDAELLVVATITTTLRRCLSVMTPPDLLASSPG